MSTMQATRKLDEELQEADSVTALTKKIGELLDNLNEFEDYLSSTLSQNLFNKATKDEHARTINNPHEKYKDMNHVF